MCPCEPLSAPSSDPWQVRLCLLCVGTSLVFGPVLGKSWRLYKVFTQRVPDKRVVSTQRGGRAADFPWRASTSEPQTSEG